MNLKDTADMALTGEFLATLLDEYLDLLLQKNPTLNKPTEKEVQELREKIIKRLQEKYPGAGITAKENKR